MNAMSPLGIPEKFHAFEHDGEVLVTPGIAIGNKSWQDWKYRWLRSMHLDAKDGSIISCGFPKFMEVGKGVGKYKVTERDILDSVGDDLFATLKIDGFLLVRYVQGGQVKFRTRGFLGIRHEDIRAELEALTIGQSGPPYTPSPLYDPTICPDDSLLFEMVTPTNQVIIRYDRPAITMIGGVAYGKDCPWLRANPKLYTRGMIEETAAKIGVPHVGFRPITTEAEVVSLMEFLERNADIEGFVVRFDDGQRMVKVKTKNYKLLHAIKEQLTSVRLAGLWLEWGQPDFTGYQACFLRFFNYDAWMESLPAVSSLFKGVKVAQATVEHVRAFVKEHRGLPRRELMAKAKVQLTSKHTPICVALLDGTPINDSVWEKLIIRGCKQFELSLYKPTDNRLPTDDI